ncbi:thiamine phosphate synthase [Novosphingobium decolorationis]|uniref:Thiamine phosphate synthase n=1 Tax=Novosphingobium decolorationis TaxID=2698673 RepID=A0ABX8E9U9_9SPHN|nr:thiamine phosphate synthase [Novosphingobium decolorationis]QVM84980.1 thiamine phosphate synthase [Novosphingobium decolorationis]
MARCYSVPVPNCHPSNPRKPQARPLPRLWLISDARNDAGLERALARLPRGSGFIYRHYHLGEADRRARFTRLARTARAHGHTVILAGNVAKARQWGADGAYGRARLLAPGAQSLRLVTVHSLTELRAAHAARADAVLLSPVFATRSHPGGQVLGPVRFRAIAARAQVPVIALGGMNAHRARARGIARWAAIDGLSGDSRHPPTASFPLCS